MAAEDESGDYVVKAINELEKTEGTQKKELAICVPTYNRQEIIFGMLDAELGVLQKHNVDLYIYDSSEGSGTEDIVIKFMEGGFTNLYYKRIDAKVHANEKVYTIYKDMENSEYKYIWMIRDRHVISEEALIYIQEALCADMPIYWIDLLKKEYGIYPINDLNEFLMGASYELLRFGAVILSVAGFIKGSDWQYYEKKYLNPKQIHASHVGYYFERCAELEKFATCRVDVPKSAVSDKTTGKSSWEHNAIQIIAECWGSIIWGLPKCYTCKKDAMHNANSSWLGEFAIVHKKSEGNYGLREFIKYGKWFRRIRTENYWFYFWASFLSVKTLKNIYFSDFVKQIRNSVLYIYGAGRVGDECGEFLDMLGIDYNGFLVNSMEQNPNMKRNHSVTTAQEALCGEPVTIIIAIAKRANDIEQIRENLMRMNGAGMIQIIDYNEIRGGGA